MVPPLAEGGRGAAAAVPARAVGRRLRSSAGGLLRHRGGAVGLGHHPAGGAVAGRAGRIRAAGPARGRLRVLLGRRGPLQRPPRRPGTAVLPGHRRGACRWPQGAGRHRRRRARVGRCVGGTAARPAPAGNARAGGDGRRRSAGAVAGAWGGVPRHPRAALLGALPKSIHAGARRALNEIIQAEDRIHAERAIEALVSDYGAKWPKAVAKVVDDAEALLCFFDYPAEHWLHLRTTNPIESTFSPVRARTRVTKGPGSRDAGLAMVFKLLEAAEGRWRAVNGPHLVALVRAGARFERGRLMERPEGKEAPEEEIDEVAA